MPLIFCVEQIYSFASNYGKIEARGEKREKNKDYAANV
ncbi:hypothetical protein ABH902_000570 [Enterococcus sp. UD-01]